MSRRAVVALVLGLCGGAHAQARPTLTLDHVLSEARANRQELRAAHARAEAAAQVPKLVGALPDPMLMGGIDHLPVSLMGADFSVQLQQDFPLSRVRGHRARAAQGEADARKAQAATASLDVEAAALRAFLMLVETQRMRTVTSDLKTLSIQVHSAVQARVSTAQATLSEAVRAELDVARLQGELAALERDVAGAWAMTEASMGHSTVTLPVPVAELRTPTEAPPELAALLQASLDQRPELAQMRAGTRSSMPPGSYFAA